ncbi:expressed unknown protein [Seminavis robusta]|uniref:Uncharacterized protein n=1 Tax=Seminavis robusta TaxID=568900 RepID=A0A9N8D4S5_9STRA|nr:expressed unknown protein [Seminavis robusta]|eukprot:Sro5_g004160.1 n/a (613) ;mRNA; f:72853-74691
MPLTQRKTNASFKLTKTRQPTSPLSKLLPMSNGPLCSNIRTGTQKQQREKLVVTVGYSLLFFWIFTLGGFSFGGPLEATTIKKIKRLTGMSLPVAAVGHVLTILDNDNDSQQQRPLASFAIEILPNPGINHTDSAAAIFTTTGPHTVEVSLMGQSDRKLFKSAKNLQPPVLRLVGDLIVPIPLWTTNQKGQWTGSFLLPAVDNAQLQLESQWTGCIDDKNNNKPCNMEHSKETKLQTKVTPEWESSSSQTPPKNPTWADAATLFPPHQAWIHVQRMAHPPLKMDLQQQQPHTQHYLWGNLATLDKEEPFGAIKRFTVANTRTLTDETDTHVALSSTIRPAFKPQWYDSFSGLSNYEIVCWIGGRTAQLLHATFLSMRGDLFPGQRPFKFHYHPIVDSLETPDTSWNDEFKEKFRKCKHVFVSLDHGTSAFYETSIAEPLSATAFEQRVLTFTQHLLKAFPDSTFPIWMVLTHTAASSPLKARYQANHCFEDGKNKDNKKKTDKQQPHSLEHPCHTVLRGMFTAPHKAELFPAQDQNRIRLMDNTDVTMATVEWDHPRPLDVLAVVALRQFILIGKQVREWRDSGQIGQIDGLHRNNTIVSTEKNLVPYQWNT